MFIIRQAIQEHLATEDNQATGQDSRKTFHKVKDENAFFEHAINSRIVYFSDPVIGD